jgi:MFS family permease
LLIGQAIAGLGLGAFTPANNATIMAASPKGHTGVIGGVLNMTRGVGTALGVALASALYVAASGASSASASPAAAANGLTVALAALGSMAFAAGLALLLVPARREKRRASRPVRGELLEPSIENADTDRAPRPGWCSQKSHVAGRFSYERVA